MATISKVPGGIDTALNGQSTVAVYPARRSPAAPAEEEPRPARQPEPPTSQKPDELQVPTLADLRELAAEVQRALDAASSEPFSVVFRQSDDSRTFVLELRNSEGELVRQFPPEIVLNLRDKLDELSGMVIDEVT